MRGKIMHEHFLPGCKPRPLASYLKALGILRLVAGQKDTQVKGWWERESFSIITNLTKDEIETFFCDEYAPTPIVAPWNGGSGFYPTDDTEGLEAIVNSDSERFAIYRNVISHIQSWPEMPRTPNTPGDIAKVLKSASNDMRPGKKRDAIEELLQSIANQAPTSAAFGGHDPYEVTLAEVESLSRQMDNPNRQTIKNWSKVLKKARTKCSEFERIGNKETILAICRSRLPEVCLQWLDALYALHADGSASFSPVLGTYGNDGNLEFSNNFMQRLAGLFISGDPEITRNLFRSSLYDATMPGLIPAKVGQYDPGRAGGYNQGSEVETKDFKINPWDFILMMEGTLVLSSAVARRHPSDERSQLSAPFTVRFSPVGFTSSEYGERGRNETWLPLWRNPAAYSEIKYLFGEGRSAVGRKMARTGLEFSRAVGMLGVDRGIDSFERYAFLARRGKSYVALPAGRIPVRYRPELELLNEFDFIIAPVDSFLREFKNLPATFESARRQIDEAIFACSQQTDVFRFCDLARAIGRLERLIAVRDRTIVPALNRPMFGLSPRWILQCDDGSIEVRIAAALASIKATGNVGSIRSQMAGVDPSYPPRWGKQIGRQAWQGDSLPERLGGVLMRRLMEAERTSAPCVPIEAELSLSPHDVMLFLWGQYDETKIEELLWGFSIINWQKFGLKNLKKMWMRPLAESVLSRTWCLLKLLHTPEAIRGVKIKREPRIAHLLQAGRIPDACGQALYRLRVSELNPFEVDYEEEPDPARLLASLLIPIREQGQLEKLVLAEKTAN